MRQEPTNKTHVLQTAEYYQNLPCYSPAKCSTAIHLTPLPEMDKFKFTPKTKSTMILLR